MFGYLLLSLFCYKRNIDSTNTWEINESKDDRQAWRAEPQAALVAWNKVKAASWGEGGCIPEDQRPGSERRLTTGNPIFLLSLEPEAQGSVTMWLSSGRGHTRWLDLRASWK